MSLKRGFAAMSPERHREIARMGGAAVPPGKRTFATNNELSKTAGAAGGRKSRRLAREAQTA